ncbi:MAG: TRAP transporter fused permease subunit [Gammaproteobacteria bacterium]|nr:TRAP transporter fused permease subunit [Gammaproteobacteria bacterium]
MNQTGSAAIIPPEFRDPHSGNLTVLSWLTVGCVVVMAVSHAIQIWTLFIPSSLFKTYHLCGAAILLSLLNAAKSRLTWIKCLHLLLLALSASCMAYIFVSFDALISERMFGPSELDVIIGVLLLISIIAIATGVWGFTIPIIAIGALLYGYFGPWFSSDLLYHSGIKFTRLISYTSIPFFEGLLGSMTGLSGSLIFVFMLFAGLLKSTGGIDFILTIASRLAGRSPGGPAQVAVIGSGIMGMISGSTVANVASTGSITIPLMKKHGFKGSYAGAVEAVASTGGQFMPPVMGLTAFLIVGITGVPYPDVMLAALLPAFIYYGNLLFAVHFHAVTSEMHSDEHSADLSPATSLWSELKQYGHLVIAIVLLVYLLVSRMPPGHAAVIAAMFIIVSELVKQIIRHFNSPLQGLRNWLQRILSGLHEGVRNGAQLAVVIAVIGVLVDMMTTTGFAQKLSNLMLSVAEGKLILLLVLAALSCLIFGLGMPTPAAYSLVAVVGAPALVGYGIDVLAAHMYVFFFANMSAVTPPVALAALVASKLAKDSYMKTAFLASRLAIPGFVLPFLFIYNPELLMLEGSIATRLLSFLTTLFGFVALNVALSGTLFRTDMAASVRCIVAISAVALIYPLIWVKVLGGFIFMIVAYRDGLVSKKLPTTQQKNRVLKR